MPDGIDGVSYKPMSL